MNKDITEKGLFTLIGSISILLLLIVLLFVKRKAIKQRLMFTMKDSFFTIDELCFSATASARKIDNTPNDVVRGNLQSLIDNILNPTRKMYGSYIKVNSGYRSQELNTILNGAKTSQHTTGNAVDITGGSVEKNKQIFEIIARNMPFDQLIWEKGGSWVHVSYDNNRNRHQILNYESGRYTDITKNWENII